MSEKLNLSTPFSQTQCEGCDLVKKAIEVGGGNVIMTCTPPNDPGEPAYLRATRVTAEFRRDIPQEGPCQVVEGAQA